MQIKQVLLEGNRAVYYNKKIILLLWFVNTIAALIVSLPVYYTLSQELSRSLLSSNIAVSFDYQWYQQFRHLFSSSFKQIHYILLSVVGAYTLIQTFLIGGLISIFKTPKKNHIVDFFYGSVKYWSRFVRVLFISLIFFAVAFKINDYLGDLISWIFHDTENELADFILRSIRYLLLVFLIGCITLISDYTKVSLAINENSKVIKEITATFKFLKNNFTSIFLVFFIVSATGASGAIIYNLIEAQIPRSPFYFLIVAFILQQMLIIFRLYIRTLFCSTEVLLYKDLSAEEVEANAEIVENS